MNERMIVVVLLAAFFSWVAYAEERQKGKAVLFFLGIVGYFTSIQFGVEVLQTISEEIDVNAGALFWSGVVITYAVWAIRGHNKDKRDKADRIRQQYNLNK